MLKDRNYALQIAKKLNLCDHQNQCQMWTGEFSIPDSINSSELASLNLFILKFRSAD